jgi:hypothetical protein
MSIKETAEELLKVAEAIEKEAAEATEFVCNKCKHIANLATINSKRKLAAEAAGPNVTVSDIGVNDTIKCPACDGVMAYTPTEASEAFYYDEKTAEEKEKEKGKKEKEEGAEEVTEASEPVDYDSLEK